MDFDPETFEFHANCCWDQAEMERRRIEKWTNRAERSHWGQLGLEQQKVKEECKLSKEEVTEDFANQCKKTLVTGANMSDLKNVLVTAKTKLLRAEAVEKAKLREVAQKYSPNSNESMLSDLSYFHANSYVYDLEQNCWGGKSATNHRLRRSLSVCALAEQDMPANVDAEPIVQLEVDEYGFEREAEESDVFDSGLGNESWELSDSSELLPFTSTPIRKYDLLRRPIRDSHSPEGKTCLDAKF